MLVTGRIRPSQSPYAAGTLLVSKKDPNAPPRVVHDYRALNDNTIKDDTPLPHQDDIIRQGTHSWFLPRWIFQWRTIRVLWKNWIFIKWLSKLLLVYSNGWSCPMASATLSLPSNGS